MPLNNPPVKNLRFLRFTFIGGLSYHLNQILTWHMEFVISYIEVMTILEFIWVLLWKTKPLGDQRFIDKEALISMEV